MQSLADFLTFLNSAAAIIVNLLANLKVSGIQCLLFLYNISGYLLMLYH